MKYSNFKIVKATDTYTHATVDITTGFLWWKKTKTHRISQHIASDFWKFTDTGEFTEEYKVEKLALVYKMTKDYENEGATCSSPD